MRKALVVYYSKSGNTRTVADRIAEAASADLEALVEVGISRKGLLGYLSAGRGGMFKKKSKIQAPSKLSADYDIVFVGTPIWGWNLAPAVRSYVGQTDFGSTPVALFCSMGGCGHEKTFASMKFEAPDANVVGELAIAQAELKDPQALQQKVEGWVRGVVSDGCQESATLNSKLPTH